MHAHTVYGETPYNLYSTWLSFRSSIILPQKSPMCIHLIKSSFFQTLLKNLKGELVSESCSVVSDFLWPHELQPTRLLCPWNSSGKDTGVGCYSLLQGSSWPRNWNWVSCIVDRFFTIWATRETWEIMSGLMAKKYQLTFGLVLLHLVSLGSATNWQISYHLEVSKVFI